MNKKSLSAGIISLVVGLVLYLSNLNVYQGVFGGVHINIYASWFFVLLGGLLILRAFFSRRSTA